MFTAYDEKRQLFCLLDQAEVPNDQMKQLVWHCPICEEAVLYRAGGKNRPHFSHYSNSSCAGSEETKEHREGKERLYAWVKTFAEEVEVEKWLPMIDRRADVWFRYRGVHYVFEMQCSPVDRMAIRERTLAYESQSIQVLWVLPAELMKRTATAIYIQEWQQEACFQTGSFPPQLMYLGQQLSIATLSAYMSPRKFIASWSSLPLTPSGFSLLIHDHLSVKNEPKAQLFYKQQSRYGKVKLQTAFSQHVQERLYRYKSPLYLHPAECGWFVPGQVWVSEHLSFGRRMYGCH
ncbi:competence protein CoiA [Geomicrobium sp. JCM 19037]|uniref:competence protein CoiA n=1 Tax=Geomicrobium sp. JCM 19037 TaxID=1460634 RepID=UPI00045F169B|nr:competence protein CoiA family protein [Geomicrobium sp. JCM 19037]GAK05785.1 competence protein CoiA [Geomicrobium sp. JCM 19037]